MEQAPEQPQEQPVEQVQPEPQAQADVQPQQTEQVEPQPVEPVQEPVQQQPAEQAPVEQQAPEQALDYQEVDYTPSDFQPQAQMPNIDINQLPRDQDGYIDPNVFAQALGTQMNSAVEQARQQARQEAQEQIQEQKLWEQAEKKHPQLAENKDLRDMVKNARLGEMAASVGKKNPSPLQIADKLFGQFNEAKQQGMAQAQQNVRVQESVALESASNTAGDGELQKTYEAATGGTWNREEASQARRSYLSSLIDKGDIKITDQ